VVAVIVTLLFGAAYRSLRREAMALEEQREKSALLERALDDNEVLFQELHHRIKNNLQIISSFLTMQKLRIRDADAEALLQESIDRIHSMGLVHQTLYLQREASEVDMAVYLRSLVAYLASSYDAQSRRIAVDVRGHGVQLDLDQAVPLALTVNEAVTNALKHAFKGHGGQISVAIRTEKGDIVVSVADDGVGLPPDAGAATGIGMHLLRALAAQLGGSVVFGRDAEGGTILTLRFPLFAGGRTT
jgi:Signal transduction histidine kinase